MVCAALLLGAAACGDDDQGQAAGGAEHAAGDSSGCGTIPDAIPADPDGFLAELPDALRDAYNGYPGGAAGSPWADWKPDGEGPYRIGLSFGNNETPFGAAFTKYIQELAHESDLVSELVVRLAADNVQNQVQQLRGLIRADVDLIINASLSADAVKPVIAEAREAGIPWIEFLGSAPSEDAVGVNINPWLAAAQASQELLKLIDERGRVLMVHGIPGVEIDTLVHEGASAVLETCPDVEPVGEIKGGFAPPVAQAETLKFLSADPQPVAAAVQTGGMAVGIVGAFEQAGREVPPVADLNAGPAFLAYWRDNQDAYDAVGTGIGATAFTDLLWQVATRTLAGKGPKVNNIVVASPLITEADLGEWVEPEWTPKTIGSGYAEPPGGELMSGGELDAFFSQPGPGEEG